MIYKKFKIAGQWITTEVVDQLEGGDYGNFNDAKNLILIAKNVEIDDELVKLTRLQMESTWYHEVFHAFQFYFNNEYSEAQAQVYSNFVTELLSSGETFRDEEAIYC